MRIQLLNAPNQTVPFVYGDKTYILTLRQFDGQVYASVNVDGEDVVLSRRVSPDEEILPCEYLVRLYGSIVFRSKYTAKITDFSVYNKSIYLEYIPPEGS